MKNKNNSFSFFKKKLAHAYFGRPYFSKFFGGKIKFFNKGFAMINNTGKKNYYDDIGIQNFLKH